MEAEGGRKTSRTPVDDRTTEYEMAEPFTCRCGHCGGAVIRGYGALSAAERRRLEPWAADHLRARGG